MQIKIESDGTPLGTKITNENGDQVNFVQSIKWELSVNNATATATIVLASVPIEAIGNLELAKMVKFIETYDNINECCNLENEKCCKLESNCVDFKSSKQFISTEFDKE